MSSLYRGLARGGQPRRKSRAEPSFFYVSTGSWSFSHCSSSSFSARAFPHGPMYLTDYPTNARFGSGAETRSTIRRLFEAYPAMPFVLIGDSGQRDPLTYEEVSSRISGPGQTHPDPAGRVRRRRPQSEGPRTRGKGPRGGYSRCT